MELDFKTELISFLGSLAFYNDKGFEWANHSPQKVEQERQQAQAQILSLIEKIGENIFPNSLLDDLKNGEASRDYTGKFKNRVEKLFREQESNSISKPSRN